VANQWAHAEQNDDGSYRTVYNPLGESRIYSLLEKGESCLTYQLSSGALKWVCFDVDIKREILQNEDYATIKPDAQTEIIKIVSLLCDFLNQKAIPYLLEFSGNRGAHVWVIWKEFVKASYGYALQQKVLEGSHALMACRFTAIDRFPQTSRSTAELGKGVKLPLSKHKKSSFYSCLVADSNELKARFDAPFATLEPDIVRKQSELLLSLVVPAWAEIEHKLNLNEEYAHELTKQPVYIRRPVTFNPGHVPTLDAVLSNLGGCALLMSVIEKCQTNEQLSEKERAILVGLLRRLKHPTKMDFGKDLLIELFSRQSNFKPNVTAAKLANLNLYPPTCSYLSQVFALKTECCDAHGIRQVQKSPVELLEGYELEPDSLDSLTYQQFEAIRNACVRYAAINDEIDLHFLRVEMERMDAKMALDSFPRYLSTQRTLGSYYTFQRPESAKRFRTLVSLGAYDALLSAWFTKILDGLFGTDISTHSYGYRFEQSLSKSNLFKPWYPQWLKYTKALSRIIEDNAFDDYWVIKVDVRSFYDQISLTRLRVKLGAGPSRACSEIIRALDCETKGQYETICSTLIEWCRKIGGSDKGVPQGPAFARYLAELYLLQFDHDVEELTHTHQAKYFRYVDDIFLIAPTQESARSINAYIRGELETLSLEVNESKAFLGTVRDYRTQYHDYKNDTKYFVDQVTRKSRTSSSALTAQAREALDELIAGSDGVEIRPENASFFLTHLRACPQNSAHVIPKLMKIEHGRGSFFRHLADYIVKDLRSFELNPERWDLSNLSGFRLEVFLNSLFRGISGSPLTQNESENLSKILTRLRNQTNSRLSKWLLIHLMLSDPRVTEGLELGDHLCLEDVLACLHQRQNAVITDKFLKTILEHLASLPIDEAIEVVYVLVMDSQLSPGGYGRCADKFFALILEQLEQSTGSSATIECLTKSKKGSGDLLRKYHSLCCLCFVMGATRKPDEFKKLWLALISLTNEMPQWNSGKAQWLEKSDRIRINQSNITALFAAGIGGDGLCPGQSDKHEVFSDYHYHLVVFLFALSNREFVESLPSKDQLLEETKAKGMVYLEWLLGPTNGVELYPRKQVCLRNIVENDITILRRNNELLVRYPKTFSFNNAPPHPPLITSKDELTNPVYRNDVFEFPSNAVALDKLIKKEHNLAGAIRLVTNLFKMLRRFRDEYVGVEKGVPNIFAEGFGVLEQILAPAITATALGSKLLITEEGIRSIPNDLGTAWGLLLEKVELSNHDLLPYKHHAQVTAKTVKNLLPEGLDCYEQVSFLEMLCDVLPTDTHASTFDIDHARLVAATLFSNELLNREADLKEGRSPTLFGRTMEIYLATSGDRSDYARKMSFNPVRCHSDKSLGDLLRTISDSLDWTKTHAKLSNQGVDLLKAIESDFLMLAQSCGQPVGSVDELLPHPLIAIIDQVRRAIVKQGDDYELIVNDEVLIASSGDVVATTATFVCRFGGETRFEEPLKPQHAADIRRFLVYSWKTNGKIVLFVADDIVRMTYEIIRKRSDAFFGTGGKELSAAEFECLEDRHERTANLRNSPHFGRACDVLRCNHFTSEHIKDTDDCERVLLRWLALFDLTEAQVLLEVIAAHQPVTLANVNEFLSNVKNHKDSSIVFSTKSPEDQGGVHRLFTLTQVGQEMIRSLQLHKAVSKIASFAGGEEKLIVLAETILSGSQLMNNFKWYYLSELNRNDGYREEQKLFKIDECKDQFVRGMKAFSSIVILAAAYTEGGVTKLRNYLSEALGIQIDRITVLGARLNDSACFYRSTEDISAVTKNAFQALINDTKRINELFKVDDDAAYRRSLKDLDLANLIVRPNSLPKKGLKIFTLHPRNTNIPPLFRLTKEHD
jgi:hypothetical protein